MGRVLFHLQVSLDGYFEGPGADLSWGRVDEELHQHFNDHLRTMAAYLEGRRTHELMAAFWPTADTDPESTPTMREYAVIWRDMPKHVYSRTLTEAPWSTSVERGIDPVAVRRIASAGDVSLGGPTLAESFLEAGLVDELWFYVHPVVVGAGRRPFVDGRPLDLRLKGSRRFGNGVMLLRYAVNR